MAKAEQLVNEFIKALGEDEDLAENASYMKEKIALIKEVFETVKPNIAEADYAEAVQMCVIKIWSNRGYVSKEEILEEINRELGIKTEDNNVVALRDIVDPYASEYTEDEKDDGLTTTKTVVPTYIKDEDSVDVALTETIYALEEKSHILNNPVDVSNAIFLDVVIRGLTREQVAKKYRMPLTTISEILEERKEFVAEKLVVDYDVVVKDVETREPYKSLAKQMTDPKNTNK